MNRTFAASAMICLSLVACGAAPDDAASPEEQALRDGPDGVAYAQITPEEGRRWNPAWNQFVSDAIDHHGADLISGAHEPLAAAKDLCPHYEKATRAEKKAIWALFLASIARYESAFNPQTRYHEPAPLNNWSEGLLQLSRGDDANHPGCALSGQSLTNPQVNLACGVAILAHQVRSRHGVLFPASFYYWSVLTNKKSQIKRDFQRDAGRLANCRTASVHAPSAIPDPANK
jgi:hypothetical protein